MLLTITTTHEPATDLGYLLHKNPERPQSVELSFGIAHVFYPEATSGRCTAAILVEVDPVGLVRGHRGPKGGEASLGQYVNDRPYAASSHLSAALNRLFGTAMSGRCKERPELAEEHIDLEVWLPVVPVRGDPGLLNRLFEPLGYEVDATPVPLDAEFPEWGPSPYFDVRLKVRTRLRDLLEQLLVLIPVLDDVKHYWVGTDEVDRLLRRGGEWLASHPERDEIARRYLRHDRDLTSQAIDRLLETQDLALREEGDDEAEAAVERPISLNEQRLAAVVAVIKASGARRVLDLGCGSGKLVGALLSETGVERIVGVDVSHRSLETGMRRLHVDTMAPRQRERVEFLQGALTYRDRRMEGFDAAALVEVVEHIDPSRLESFERVVFVHAAPRLVVVTTPNAEYNVRFDGFPVGELRHHDHRFEWKRSEFVEWATGVAERNGYAVEFAGIGPDDDERYADADGGVPPMTVKVPELSLIVLIGASGSGKSTFAAQHFLPTEVLSSDFCRGLVSDDENDQASTNDAFDVLHYIAGKRLAAGRLTVVDATNVQVESRRQLVTLAKAHHVLAIAVVLDVPIEVCLARNEVRPDRTFGGHVVRRQLDQMRRSMRGLRKEGFHRVAVLSGIAEIEAATFERERVWNDRRDDHGPFDLIGDVHGCFDELIALLSVLGYELSEDGSTATHPEGRRAIFLGDLVDRGPKTPAVLRLAMGMARDGTALCIPGNHEAKLLRALQGRQVTTSHGLAESLEQLKLEPEEFTTELIRFLDSLIGHYVLDDGQLVVAHAGLPAAMHGRTSGVVRSFALYGDTTGETDDFGLPVRYPWAEDYRGDATVVYGHTPVPEAVWINRTICIDTGCVFGGQLTALRYPERELVSVRAAETYYEPVRPLVSEAPTANEPRVRGELDLADVTGKQIVSTRLTRTVTIREENAIAALEVMSRFAIDPRWLLYLPPTMAPTQTSRRPGLLEHPEDAFNSFRADGVATVVCEEKHMGSRAVVVVCKDEAAAARRFVAGTASLGVIYTRTGRPFFRDPTIECAMLERARAAMTAAGLWDELETDWLVLDCELLPWSAKAEELLKTQYAPVGAAASATLSAELDVLRAASARGGDVNDLLERTTDRTAMVEGYLAAYREYCWAVESLDDLKIAPFQVLAGEGEVYALRDHLWHLEVLSRLGATDQKAFRLTQHAVVDLTDAASMERGVAWWEDLTSAGGEGMVVKPVNVVEHGPKGLVQPGIKCRSREYLRIIYGPEYTAPVNLERLRSRGLGLKRSLAAREFSLGMEALHRFVEDEPLYRVHECVFGVLALESEPVDPRL